MIINYDKKKPLIFSLNKKDFDVQFYKASSGPGGQKQNKTANACRITHPESGARGQCKEHRSREQNKKEAFLRMVNTKTFRDWMRYQTAVVNGDIEKVEKKVDEMMKDKYLKTEVFQDKKWSQYEDPTS